MRPVTLPLLLALIGCANTMHGEVEGEKVGAPKDAVFQIESVGALVGGGLVLTGASDSCDYLDAIETVGGGCEEYCEEIQPIARDHLPNGDLWTLTILYLSLDQVVRSYGHGGWADMDGFGATIDRRDVSHLRDVDECIQMCQMDNLDGDGNSENSTGGALHITDYQTGESLEGEYSIEFGGDLVEGHFSANWCEVVEMPW